MSFQDEEKTSTVETPPSAPEDRTVASEDRTQASAPCVCPVCGATSPGMEIYCVDCGFLLSETPGEAPTPSAPPAVLVDQNGREFRLRAGENELGRESADFPLMDSSVSRKHARITVGESSVEIEDLGSTNGTEVDAQRLEPNVRTALHDGSEIVLGGIRLTLKAGTMVLPSEPAVAEAEPAEPKAEVEAVAWLVAGDGAEYVVHEGVNAIGRREGNDIRLTSDQYISGRHAELKAEGGVFTLTDLGSTNGTLVGSEPLQPESPRVVSADDELTFGRTTLRLKLRGESGESASGKEQTQDGGE